MKRFLITNPKFKGAAELVYNEKDHLQKIDVSNTDMDVATITAFKRSVPVMGWQLVEAFSEKTTIVEADIAVSFDMFWTAYRKKINRLRCEALWKKLDKTEQVQAFLGIKNYDKFLHKEDWRNKADPDTYLRNKYYQNEYK